ncbi:hypothetical protein [Arthrobacter psychrolactophilus]|uniref:hypothetical protein n=1 Tax=Arthrobacter psychrolactophilus TaxID=92442 RepID=UPI0015E8DF47|nr:hypothetical protein [Arthrobacter psychrolactophilus]
MGVRSHHVCGRTPRPGQGQANPACASAAAGVGLAMWSHVSIMLAGFTFGLAVSTPGEPAALVLGALVTMAAATVAAGRYANAGTAGVKTNRH